MLGAEAAMACEPLDREWSTEAIDDSDASITEIASLLLGSDDETRRHLPKRPRTYPSKCDVAPTKRARADADFDFQSVETDAFRELMALLSGAGADTDADADATGGHSSGASDDGFAADVLGGHATDGSGGNTSDASPTDTANMSEEEKAADRRRRNRISAAASRKRKTDAIATLSARVSKLEAENRKLSTMLINAQTENCKLRTTIGDAKSNDVTQEKTLDTDSPCQQHTPAELCCPRGASRTAPTSLPLEPRASLFYLLLSVMSTTLPPSSTTTTTSFLSSTWAFDKQMPSKPSDLVNAASRGRLEGRRARWEVRRRTPWRGAPLPALSAAAVAA